MAVKIAKGGARRPQSVYTAVRHVRKADTQLVIAQPIDIEDEFAGLYTATGKSTNAVMEPPFNPLKLIALCTQNNILQQCIHVMEVNVDGTGHTIEEIEEGASGVPPEKTAPTDSATDPLTPPATGATDPNADPAAVKSPIQKAGFPFKKGGGQPATDTTVGADPSADGKPPFSVAPKAKPPAPLDPEKRKAEDFFKEPFPGMSMVSLRRKLRVDLEQTGYGYLEPIRNIKGELMLLRHVPAQTVRKLRLDDPVVVSRTVVREGKEISVEIPLRERRYVQQVGSKIQYFKEFGSARGINRKTGNWIETPADQKAPLAAVQDRTEDPPVMKPVSKMSKVSKAASILDGIPFTPVSAGKFGAEKVDLGGEIIEFMIDRDPVSSYAQPRWINNLPSVLGSRKAEIFNLDFFDAGAIPPILILIEGGSLTRTVREQLQQQLSGKGGNNNRAAIVEIQSASGMLDKPGAVGVKVERFGDARQSDSMFQKYDVACEEHVRVAFRLPTLFLGKSADFNFATAVTSYMVAEEQVFKPERTEFDEVINKTIMKALGIKKFRFVSKPIVLKNVEMMMKALEAGKTYISPDEYISKLNEIAGTTLTYDEASAQREINNNDLMQQAKASAMGRGLPVGGGDPGQGDQPPGSRPKSGVGSPSGGIGVSKADYSLPELARLSDSWMSAVGLSDEPITERRAAEAIRKADALIGIHRRLFDGIVAKKMFTADPDGLTELTDHCMETMA